jgi:hypothetical protein
MFASVVSLPHGVLTIPLSVNDYDIDQAFDFSDAEANSVTIVTVLIAIF